MIISEMRNLGLEFAMFLIDPGDNRLAKLFAPRAEEMLEKYSDTAYAKHLSVALGMVRLRLVRHEAHRRPDFDPKSLAQEQVIAAKKYFEPYCKGEIKSLHQAGAAYELAAKVLNRLRYEPEDASEESAAARREAKMLLEKVKNSPYSLDYAVKAAAELRELGD
jgi:hypothetical protein